MRPAPSRLADLARELLVTAGGLGLAPWAPGTVGTWGGLARARSEEHTSELQAHSESS